MNASTRHGFFRIGAACPKARIADPAGNLAEILDNVAHTMRERERIRGEIRTLTSQQRMTGYVIGGIPIGLGIIFMMISPEFTGKLFTDPLGRMMLGGAIGMEILGFAVIRKIVNIEV